MRMELEFIIGDVETVIKEDIEKIHLFVLKILTLLLKKEMFLSSHYSEGFVSSRLKFWSFFPQQIFLIHQYNHLSLLKHFGKKLFLKITFPSSLISLL